MPADPGEPDNYQIALLETAPESGAFILFSLRCRNLSRQRGGAVDCPLLVRRPERSKLLITTIL
jgi:hypothetical protein